MNACCCSDRRSNGADHLAKEIAADGERAAGCRTDVGNRADVDRAVDLARGEFGPVGILVTSAGVTNVEPFSRMTLESWNRVIGINLTGTRLAKRFGALLTIPQIHGHQNRPRG